MKCYIKSCKEKATTWIQKQQFCQKHFKRYKSLRYSLRNLTNEELFKYFLEHPEYDFWRIRKEQRK